MLIEIYPIGTPLPLQITDWQLRYAETYGNKPSILILEETQDELGVVCDREITDATKYRYGTPTQLERIKILIQSATGMLKNKTTVIIK